MKDTEPSGTQSHQDKIETTSAVYAIPAQDMDVVDVARVTGGNVSFDKEGIAIIRWDDSNSSLSVKGEGEDRVLWFERGGESFAHMESTGLVMGEDFIAFVYPYYMNLDIKNKYDVEIIEKDNYGVLRRIDATPISMLHPAFVEAGEIARTNMLALLNKEM